MAKKETAAATEEVVVTTETPVDDASTEIVFPVELDEEDEADRMLRDLFHSDPPAAQQTASVVKKEKVKVVSEEELKIIKEHVVFRMGEGVSDKFSFSKVVNISRQEKDTVLVILYLNENGHDRSHTDASFTEVSMENFIAQVNGVYFDFRLVENFKMTTKFFNRTEHFGKIVVALSKQK